MMTNALFKDADIKMGDYLKRDWEESMEYVTATFGMVSAIYHVLHTNVYQKQGFGSYIMDCLETEISKQYDVAVLDASLAAVFLYEHRGYKTVGHGICELENDVKLVYEVMEKKFKN